MGLAVNKKLRAGIVYNPITNELFTAQAGKGALKNGFPIHVSKAEGRLFYFLLLHWVPLFSKCVLLSFINL